MILLLQSDFSLFIGHLHPLVVHLPIGFLLLAGVFFYLGRKDKYEYLQKALPVTLFLSAISSIAAAFIGWLLAGSGGYEDSALFWHKWLGIGIAVGSTLAWLWSIGKLGGTYKTSSWAMVALLPVLFMTGHLGGNLTHGEGYLLKNAPVFLQKIFGAADTQLALDMPSNPDSIRIYSHLLQPVFDQKCVQCHNEKKSNGDLLLTTQEGLLKGGDHGPVLVKAATAESELFHRVTMNTNSKKFMPPTGPPMAYHEIKLLDYWISSGLSFDLRVTDKNIPPDIKALIEKQYGISAQRKDYVAIKTVSAATAEQITNLQAQGFSVSPLAATNNFLEVTIREPLTLEKMNALAGIKEQLTWLNISDTGIKDDWLAVLSDCPNLTRLRLEKNELTNAGLKYLSGLKHLASLNLYNTAVSDEGLRALEGIKSLQKVFLWQTKVTPDGAKALQDKIPGLEIDLGIEFAQKED